MTRPREIVIRFSAGEAKGLWDILCCAVRYRSWDVIPKSLWVMREHLRRGTWQPWTVGDLIVLRRRRKRRPDQPQPFWRHSYCRAEYRPRKDPDAL